MKLINTVTEGPTDSVVAIFRKLFGIVTEIVAEKTIFQCERMGDLELLPSYHAACPDFIRLHLKATVFKTKHVGFLSENAGQ